MDLKDQDIVLEIYRKARVRLEVAESYTHGGHYEPQPGKAVLEIDEVVSLLEQAQTILRENDKKE